MLTALQQTADNADQIKEIEERVQSLGEVLASPVGVRDDAEKARRNALRKLVISPLDKHWHFLNISLGYPQEVRQDNGEARAAFRTTWDREILEERQSHQDLEWFRPRLRYCRDGLPGVCN